MSIAGFFTTTATINTPSVSTTDAEGNAVTTAATATVPVHRQPRERSESSELTGDLNMALSLETLWMPLGTTINHGSTVTIGTDIYEVIGSTKQWLVGSPNDHLEVVVRRVDR